MPVASMTVGVVRRAPEDRDAAGGFVPPHDPVVRDITPQQAAVITEPDRPFGPSASREDPFNGRVADSIWLEPGIEDPDRAMQDGFSTYRGLGLGLPGAKRLMDQLHLSSTPGAGTTVTMEKWLP